MMSPELAAQAPILSGVPYNITRVWGTRDYPFVTHLFRRAFDARHQFVGFGQFYYPVFADACIGLDGYGRLIKFTLTQYSGIDAWRVVTPIRALKLLCRAEATYQKWRDNVNAVLIGVGYYEL